MFNWNDLLVLNQWNYPEIMHCFHAVKNTLDEVNYIQCLALIQYVFLFFFFLSFFIRKKIIFIYFIEMWKKGYLWKIWLRKILIYIFQFFFNLINCLSVIIWYEDDIKETFSTLIFNILCIVFLFVFVYLYCLIFCKCFSWPTRVLSSQSGC